VASGRPASVLDPIRTLFDAGTAAGFTDRELLERFATRRDGVAEVAFAALVERHGSMVLRVCRGVLRDSHDADDAFQATFLILARRARSIRKRDSVGPWLYGVALRVAGCALRTSARRRKLERRGADMIEHNPEHSDTDDSARVLHEELGRIPEKYRAPVVLCYLEGLTHEQAADQLGWPIGTVRTRLSWARERLRMRLTRRGLAPTAMILGNELSTGIGVPATLAEATIRSAMSWATAGAVPATVAALAGEALRSLSMSKLKMIALGVVATGLVVSAGGLVAARQGPADGEASKPAQNQPAQTVANPTRSDDGNIPYSPSSARRVSDLPRSRVSGPSEPPRILAARLDTARRVLAIRDALSRTGEMSKEQFEEARGEVAVLTAELDSYRDDLRDELELLSAQLEMREADLAGAEALLKQIEQRVVAAAKLHAQALTGDQGFRSLQQDLEFRKSQRDLKKAERREVETRIAQVRRRLGEVEPIIKAASLPLKAAPDPTSPPAPAK
jgi:RNA polymerase sigma factor (sigma-70 family)